MAYLGANLHIHKNIFPENNLLAVGFFNNEKHSGCMKILLLLRRCAALKMSTTANTISRAELASSDVVALQEGGFEC